MTAETVAVKLAEVAPVLTTIEAGTATDVLLLEREMLVPPLGAAPLRVTEQVSVPAAAKLEVLQLRLLRVAGGAINWTANDWLAPPAVAVRVAVSDVVTADTEAERLALLAPAGTLTIAGRVTSGVLLANETLNPPLGAGPLRLKEQLSVPAAL